MGDRSPDTRWVAGAANDLGTMGRLGWLTLASSVLLCCLIWFSLGWLVSGAYSKRNVYEEGFSSVKWDNGSSVGGCQRLKLRNCAVAADPLSGPWLTARPT